MKGNRVCEPPGLQTLFLEMLFKLLSQGFVPAKSRQEVTRWAQPSLAPRPGFRENRTWGEGAVLPPENECPDLRFHFLDPRPSLSQRKTNSLRSCLGFPTCKMEESEEALSEPAVPLFSPKLLFQEATGPAVELERSEPGAWPGPACACAHGPHLLLPGCPPQWSLQFSAGALPAHTVQSRCAPSRSTG